MPTRHSLGDEGTAVLYCADATTGRATAVLSVGGAQSVSMAIATSGGLLNRRLIATADTNAALVKAGATQVYGIEMANNAAYAVFLKLFNKVSAPVPGTDVPVWTIQIPAGGRAEINRPAGVEFPLGLGISATKLVADNDTTALVAADLVGTVSYK